MTVSRVLRNESNVSEKTAAKIQKIADRLGYKRNRLVKGMQSGKSGIVSVVLPVGHAIAPTILEGIYDYLHERDLMMSLDFVHASQGNEAVAEQSKVINRLLETRVDGILLLPVNEAASPLYFKEVVDRKIPLVLIDRNTTHFNADFVGTDDRAGGKEAARLLAANGCKNVVLISTGEEVSTSRLRAEGFVEGAQEHKLTLVKEVIVPTFNHNTELIETELAPLRGIFDGIFGIADRIAISAWHTCRGLGLSIPEDVKVIGFGALNLRDPRVALTSFDQKPREIGRLAAELLVSRIEKGPWKRMPKAKDLLTKPVLVEGTSCVLSCS